MSTPTRMRSSGRSRIDTKSQEDGGSRRSVRWWQRIRRQGAAPDPVAMRRPRRWPWIVALTVAGALLCGAVYTVFFSPVLGVTSIAISGATDPVAAQVRAVIDVPDGTPLARIDLDDVADQVKAVPEVAAVEVARGWPDTLTIAVTPRVPVAVTSANGRFYLLDNSGDPYLAVDAPPAGMINVELVTPGTGDPSTTAALAVAAALTPDFRAQVASISAPTAFDVELTMTDDTTIIWGGVADSAMKMQILPALLAAQDGTEYDITDPTLVSVR